MGAAPSVEEDQTENVAGAAVGKDAKPSSTLMTDASNPIAPLKVQSMSGRTLAEIVPPLPSSVEALKSAISSEIGVEAMFMKILCGAALLIDDDLQKAYASQVVTVIIENSEPFLWDTIKNPDADQLVVEGRHVRCPEMRSDYVNVVTQDPLPAGKHFVEFVLHRKLDEQTCGVVQDKALGWGSKMSANAPEFAESGCFYYCGRGKYSSDCPLGRLNVPPGYPKWERTNQPKGIAQGDILGMMIDCDNRAIAYSRNGEVMGSSQLPPEGPLHLLTQVDTKLDHVELRRRDVEDAPQNLMLALTYHTPQSTLYAHLKS